MLMLSGYTLGFFFPKQTKYLANPPAASAEDKPKAPEYDLAFIRPDAASEAREVPAAYYFYRYF